MLSPVWTIDYNVISMFCFLHFIIFRTTATHLFRACMDKHPNAYLQIC